MSEEKFGDLENTDITNEVFWQRLSETFAETLGMLKEMAAEKGIDLDSIELEDEDDFKTRWSIYVPIWPNPTSPWWMIGLIQMFIFLKMTILN
jgi:hypothetical protein